MMSSTMDEQGNYVSDSRKQIGGNLNSNMKLNLLLNSKTRVKTNKNTKIKDNW